jgi:hypothetical protein
MKAKKVYLGDEISDNFMFINIICGDFIYFCGH